VWTVPGGPAEKSGLQQGDKVQNSHRVRSYRCCQSPKRVLYIFFYRPQVLEWAGMPLANRSFEEVCGIIDRSGDVVELLVEQGYEL